MIITDKHREVLEILAEGRANPLLIRQRTGREKGEVNTLLTVLEREGLVEQVVRGLWAITDDGRAMLDD